MARLGKAFRKCGKILPKQCSAGVWAEDVLARRKGFVYERVQMPSGDAARAQEVYETVMEFDCSLPMADVCVGYSDLDRTITDASQFDNGRRGRLSGGPSEPSSVGKETSRRRLHEALPSVLAHLLSST